MAVVAFPGIVERVATRIGALKRTGLSDFAVGMEIGCDFPDLDDDEFDQALALAVEILHGRSV